MSENDELLARIGRLAGQINRHKNQSTQPQQSYPHAPHVARHVPSHSGWAPYSRGRGRGRRPVAPHRHRTLVLNNGASGSTPSSTSSPGVTSDNDGETRPAPTSNGWVAKNDRHMQLINSAVYDKEKQARAKAMEESRKMKEQRRAQREQTKVLQYAQGSTGASVSTASQQILVNDVPFKVMRGGSKLVRVSNDPSTANATPKRVTVAGVTFVRSKNGNLHRLGAVAPKKFVIHSSGDLVFYSHLNRQPGAVKKRDELCKRFTTTGTCYKGPACLYTHDPNKVAICKDFLQTGDCSAGTNCDLSHEPSPHRSPACLHFKRGRCSNDNCRYAHVRTTPGAPVCRAFATLGYCEKGSECEERHVHECPDYANSGICHKKRCKLPHVDRAGQIRKAAAAAASKAEAGEEDSDESSEEEEYDAIDSDDIDSDEFDEEMLEGVDSGEMSQQQDFIRF